MVKPKLIKEEGQVLNVEPEKVLAQQPEIIEVSYTQAKKMVKKPMSEKQMENAKRLVEMNRLKWEAKRKEKDEQERKKQEEIQQTKKMIVVKPKRVYPKRLKEKEEEEDNYTEVEEEVEEKPKQQQQLTRTKKPVVIQDSSDEEEEEVYQKPKVKKEKSIEKDIEKLKKINETLQTAKQPAPVNPYNNMLSKFFKS